MNILKHIAFILQLSILLTNCSKQETTPITEERNKKITQFHEKYSAYSVWYEKLRPYNFHSIQLKKEWLSDKPIMFYGVVIDVTEEENQYYTIDMSFDKYQLILINKSLRVKARIPKAKISQDDLEKILSLNTFLTSELKIIVKINKLETQDILNEGEINTMIIGHGDILDYLILD